MPDPGLMPEPGPLIASWPCPLPGGAGAQELALACDRGRPVRLLIVPALFDEANRLRRFAAETMRRLDEAGIDSFLPDLPGTNESLAPLAAQSLGSWRAAMAAAAAHFAATHVLALRGGALVAPALDGRDLAPVGGSAILRQMLRMRILSAREAGRDETRDGLLAEARHAGITLAGYTLGPAMVRELEEADTGPARPSPARPSPARPSPARPAIAPSDLGGAPLWLRAEPDEDPAQSAALAALLAMALAA